MCIKNQDQNINYNTKEKKIKLVLGSFVVDCTSNQLDAMTERNA